VRLRDAAVGGPARVSEAGRRAGAVRAGGLLQEGEVPDGADIVEALVLTERDPGRVVAAVLEPLEAVEEKRLAGPRPDVSDDSAHLKPSFVEKRSSPLLNE